MVDKLLVSCELEDAMPALVCLIHSLVGLHVLLQVALQLERCSAVPKLTVMHPGWKLIKGTS